MKLFVDEMPKYCTECPYFREGEVVEQRCGLCHDGFLHFRVFCPLCSLQKHDIEVKQQVCEDLTNYILNKTKEDIKHV